MSDETRKHEFEILIDAPVDEVWQAITTGEQIQQWFAPEARLEDGKLFLSWGPGMEGSAPISIWEPGKRVAWTEEHCSGPRVVDFILEGEGGKTRLRLVHSGFGKGASFEDEYESTHGGWLTFLAALRYLAERRDKRGRHVWKFSMLPGTPSEFWPRLAGQLQLGSQDWTPGAHYTAAIPGGDAFHGTVLAAPKPGYALLRVDELDGSLLALFVERGGGQTLLTTSWYLYGSGALGEPQLLRQWARFYETLTQAGAEK